MSRTYLATRDRYFDALRAAAIVRVVVYHAFPFVPLALVFPSMGVMFALGGSLMAASVDRSASRAVRSRLRRLLPALWVMGIVLVPLMWWAGWPDRPAWPRLLLWLLPVADPPAGDGLGGVGAEGAGVLWYLVTYLWLVVLSPPLRALYRRWRLPVAGLPLVGLALLQAFPDRLPPSVEVVLTNVCTFGPCWLLGFAHRDGDLRRLPAAPLLAAAVAGVLGALGWSYTHRSAAGFDPNDIPLAYAVYSIGFVLALLRWSPPMGWLARRRPLDGFVTMVNNRAVTIYLWHNVLITLAVIVGDLLKVWRLGPPAVVDLAYFSLALSMLAIVVLGLGWVEDVAARRPARISPWPAGPRGPTSAGRSPSTSAAPPTAAARPVAAAPPTAVGRAPVMIHAPGRDRVPLARVIRAPAPDG